MSKLDLLFVVLVVLVIALFVYYRFYGEFFYEGPHPLRDFDRMWLGGCVDKHWQCPYWASANECKRNAEFMLNNCPNSCGVCHMNKKEIDEEVQEAVVFDAKTGLKTCNDRETSSQCKKWKGIGFCEKHPMYMSINCAASCGLCHYKPGLSI